MYSLTPLVIVVVMATAFFFRRDLHTFTFGQVLLSLYISIAPPPPPLCGFTFPSVPYCGVTAPLIFRANLMQIQLRIRTCHTVTTSHKQLFFLTMYFTYS